NGVGMQLLTEDLLGCPKMRLATGAGVFSEDRRSGKPEQIVLLEGLGNGLMHITELGTVALIENNDHMPVVDRMALVPIDESRELLDGGDNDPGVRILQLLL